MAGAESDLHRKRAKLAHAVMENGGGEAHKNGKGVSQAAICTIASVAPINRYQDGPPQIGAMCNTPPADAAIFDQIK